MITFIASTLEEMRSSRIAYLNALPQFQELYIELMTLEADCLSIKIDSEVAGHAIKLSEGVLIEFFLKDEFIPKSQEVFILLIESLDIHEVYCKSFDGLLLSNCVLNGFSYEVLGVLYRDYTTPGLKEDTQITMFRADLSSIDMLMKQDETIHELFETEEQLSGFITHHHVFTFLKDGQLVGCGMVIKTHSDYNYCDLGIWTEPLHRGQGLGTQILLKLRKFALENELIPSCGCAVDNIASQKTIEKSGFVSKYKLLKFNCI